MERYSSQEVAAAILVYLNGSLDRKEVAKRVEATGLSGLGKHGKTPHETIGKFMSQNNSGFFERVDKGCYKSTEKAKKDPKIKALIQKIQAISLNLGAEGNTNDVGSGFSDYESRLKTEKAAISYVENIYKNEGWVVKSVELDKKGYDLLCTRGSQIECVEVKGIQGNKLSFIITDGEVKQAERNPNFVIYIVTAAIENPQYYKYTGQELIKNFDLIPLSFKAEIKLSK